MTPYSRQKQGSETSKTIPFPATHTHTAHIWEYPPPPLTSFPGCRSHVPGEILPSIRMKFLGFLLFGSWLCFAFYQRTFLRPGASHDDERIWFRKRDHDMTPWRFINFN